MELLIDAIWFGTLGGAGACVYDRFFKQQKKQAPDGFSLIKASDVFLILHYLNYAESFISEVQGSDIMSNDEAMREQQEIDELKTRVIFPWAEELTDVKDA